MPKSKQFMSGAYVAQKGEESGHLVTTNKHPFGESYTIHDGKGNSLTVPNRPLAPCEQQVSNGWFKKFLGVVLLIVGIICLIAFL